MHILLTGGSGLIGRQLVKRLLAQQHHITVLTRNPSKTYSLLGDTVQLWSTLDNHPTLDGVDAVINLAGESIAARRWTASGKQRLCQSRWQITERLTQMITASRIPPAVLLSGSAVGYYGDLGDQVITEQTSPHDEFTHQLCQHWEQLALRASAHCRVCLLRTGVVLADNGGMLTRLLPLFRSGLGGRMGHGQQYLSWIHIEDVINSILWLLEQPLCGVFNLTAPQPVTNASFTRSLGTILHRPTPLPVPGWAMRWLLGESAALVLASQRVLPARLLASGFQFRNPQVDDALRELLVR